MARHVRSAAIHLAWILAAESAATVATATTVCVHDNFAASQAAITVRTANFKAAGWIHKHANVVVPPTSKRRLDDVLNHFLLQAILLLVPHGRVLRGQNHGINARWNKSVVLHGHLALGIWAQAFNRALLADIGLAAH